VFRACPVKVIPCPLLSQELLKAIKGSEIRIHQYKIVSVNVSVHTQPFTLEERFEAIF